MPGKCPAIVLLLFLAAGIPAGCVSPGDANVDSAEQAPDSVVAAADALTPWEAARRRGADFRAIGQEPGWTIEVHEGEILRYIGDYGRDTVSGAIDLAQADSSGVVAYALKVGTRLLNVTIRPDACQDAMSGEAFSHSVGIRIDGNVLSGCGRRL